MLFSPFILPYYWTVDEQNDNSRKDYEALFEAYDTPYNEASKNKIEYLNFKGVPTTVNKSLNDDAKQNRDFCKVNPNAEAANQIAASEKLLFDIR